MPFLEERCKSNAFFPIYQHFKAFYFSNPQKGMFLRFGDSRATDFSEDIFLSSKIGLEAAICKIFPRVAERTDGRFFPNQEMQNGDKKFYSTTAANKTTAGNRNFSPAAGKRLRAVHFS